MTILTSLCCCCISTVSEKCHAPSPWSLWPETGNVMLPHHGVSGQIQEMSCSLTWSLWPETGNVMLPHHGVSGQRQEMSCSLTWSLLPETGNVMLPHHGVSGQIQEMSCSLMLCKRLMFTSGSLKLTSGGSPSGSGLLVTSCDQ